MTPMPQTLRRHQRNKDFTLGAEFSRALCEDRCHPPGLGQFLLKGLSVAP